MSDCPARAAGLTLLIIIEGGHGKERPHAAELTLVVAHGDRKSLLELMEFRTRLAKRQLAPSD